MSSDRAEPNCGLRAQETTAGVDPRGRQRAQAQTPWSRPSDRLRSEHERSLRQTPLYDWHLAAGARLVAFAGCENAR